MKNNIFKYVLIFFFALLLQATVIDYIQILRWQPDLVLIILVMFSLQYGRAGGSTAGFLSGLFGDLISAHLVGLGALSKSIAGYVSGGLAQRFQERSQFILTLFFTGLVHDFLYFFIITLGKEFSWHLLLFVDVIPNLLYTILLGTFLYYTLGNWLIIDER